MPGRRLLGLAYIASDVSIILSFPIKQGILYSRAFFFCNTFLAEMGLKFRYRIKLAKAVLRFRTP